MPDEAITTALLVSQPISHLFDHDFVEPQHDTMSIHVHDITLQDYERNSFLPEEVLLDPIYEFEAPMESRRLKESQSRHNFQICQFYVASALYSGL